MDDRAPNKWRRYLKIAAGTLTVGVLALAFALRSPSPVGHWNSAASEDRFLAAYDRAFEDLPDPAETLDIRTDYGVVRVYRFAGTGTSTHPLLLLPGRSSATPVWAANLPGLLTIGDVYTVDLLGEPGRSIQERPITATRTRPRGSIRHSPLCRPTRSISSDCRSVGGPQRTWRCTTARTSPLSL